MQGHYINQCVAHCCGDVSDIAVYCCGDHSRDPGQDLLVDGKPIALSKDGACDEFNKLMQASRNRMPDGKPCQDCHFYRVSATLTGLFLSEKRDGKQRGGYGHLGCCSLLVIERVTDVTAKRTGIPLGVFACSKSDWKPKQALPEYETYDKCNSDCDHETESLIKRIADHWGDQVLYPNGNVEAYIDPELYPAGHLKWTSEDLLIAYLLVSRKTNPPTFSVTREKCQHVGESPPPTRAISCEEYGAATLDPDTRREFNRLTDASDFKGSEQVLATFDEKVSENGDQGWRTKSLSGAARIVLGRQLESWGITADQDMRAYECTPPKVPGDDFRYARTNCSWYSPDGMQEFSVELWKPKEHAAAEDRSRWLLDSANARICRFDPAGSLAATIVP